MSESSCYEKMRKELRNYFIATLAFIALCSFFVYKKLKAKIYHTSFINQEIQEQIYGVNIVYDKSRGKIEVTPDRLNEPIVKVIREKK